jgi:eukaryotic-like serine/threonine-protein kinase
MQTPRLSLTTKIFLSSAGIVTLVLATALLVASRSAQRAARTNIERRLDETQERVKELVASDRAQLGSRSRGYAESPDFRSRFETSTDTGDFLDMAQTAAEETGARWVQLVDANGVGLARSDAPGAPRDTIKSLLVRAALDGHPAEAFGVAGDTALLEIIALPIHGANARISGALVAARIIGDSLVRAAGSATESEILFYALDHNDYAHAAAATEIARRADGAVLAAVVAHADTGVRQAGTVANSSAPVENIDVQGEHFVGRQASLASAAGTPVGGFVALRSLDRELTTTGYTQLRNTLLFAGAGGLLVALLVAGITARQIVRPVTMLADATRRASEGDYQAKIPTGGRDEIGTLASAFQRLLADLKDKQALVEFLGGGASGGAKTLMMSSNAPTMKTAMGGITMLEPGQTLASRYQIEGVLGVGGMGMVYKARDRELGEEVAIKTLKPEMIASDPSALERFKSEIKLARRISHRNVVRTHDLGESNGLYYITMEYVEGKSLKDLVRERGRLPASAVLPIAKQLCRALEIAHEEGVIHRDIKPQNMVVEGDGVLKVMDFGIARLATRPADSGHTQAGMVVGTPEYMAPEQLLGDELDARADLYATGAVLYECLTGRVPITADSPIVLISKVLEEKPVAPNSLQPDIPAALSDLIMWALAKDREQRPRSAAEMHQRLDAIALN